MSSRKLTVLYATQTGVSLSIARDHILPQAADHGYEAEMFCFDQFAQAKPAFLKDVTFNIHDINVAVIVVSTTGDGEVPDNGLDFVRYIRRKVDDGGLGHYNYAILGLGDTNYSKFANGSVVVNKALQKKGATRFHEYAKADAATPSGLEDTVEPWLEGLWPSVEKVFARLGGGAGAAAAGNGVGGGDVSANGVAHDNTNGCVNGDTTATTNGTSNGVTSATTSDPAAPSTTTATTTMTATATATATTTTTTTATATATATPTTPTTNGTGTKTKSKGKRKKGESGPAKGVGRIKRRKPKKPTIALTTPPPDAGDVVPIPLAPVGITAASDTVAVDIVDSRTLTGPEAVKRIASVDVDLKTGFDGGVIESILPGDALGFYVPNSAEEVERCLDLLGLTETAHDLVVLSTTTPAKTGHLPTAPTTLAAVLTWNVCLRPRAVASFLTVIAEGCTNPETKAYLETMIYSDVEEDPTARDEFALLRESCVLLSDLLERFESQPPVEALLGVLQPLRPRYFSVASSVSDGIATFLFSVPEFTPAWPIGNTRTVRGLATSWLANDSGDRGTTAHVFLKKRGTFVLDPLANANRPTIMVAAGVGVAPFLAYAEYLREAVASGAVTPVSSERGESESDSGGGGGGGGGAETWLFYGVRYSSGPCCDCVCADKLNDYDSSGLLTRLVLACSRESDECCYVQDALGAHKDELVKLLAAGGVIYVCGDAKGMCKGVECALADLLGGDEEGMAAVNDLESNGQLFKDVW